MASPDRAIEPASMPSPSPPPVGDSRPAGGEHLPGPGLLCRGRLSPGRWTVCGGTWPPSRGRGVRSASVLTPARRDVSGLSGLLPGRAGGVCRGRRHGEEGLRIAEALDSPRVTPDHCPWLARPSVPPQGDLHQAISVLERGLALCQASDIRSYFRMARRGPGLCVCAPGASRGRAAAGAGDGTGNPHGRTA